MGGRFWISVVVMSVLCLANGFVVHGLLLHGDHSQLPNLLRTETDIVPCSRGQGPWS